MTKMFLCYYRTITGNWIWKVQYFSNQLPRAATLLTYKYCCQEYLYHSTCLLAAHALSGCDKAAPYNSIGKLTVIKKLREGAMIEVTSYSMYRNDYSAQNGTRKYQKEGKLHLYTACQIIMQVKNLFNTFDLTHLSWTE